MRSAPRAPALAEWTVMVFLNAKNNLEEYSFLNFDQMASVGSTDAVNVIVEFGRPKRHHDTSHGPWSGVRRFRVTQGMPALANQALADLGAANMGAGATLTRFVEESMAQWPAKRYALILWDHGQGWRTLPPLARLAPGEDPFAAVRVTPPAPNRRTRAEEQAGRAGGGYRSVSHDDDTQDKLYNREIQDALEGLLAGRKLDLIGFDACLMAMIETGYALRRVATHLVASEELEPGEGWDYAGFLAPLVARPTMSPASLAKAIVAAYAEAQGDANDATLSAVDLGRMDAAAAAVDALARHALAHLDTELPALKKARSQVEKYVPGDDRFHGIDLLRFLDRLKASTSGASPELRALAASARVAVKASILKRHAARTRKGDFGSNGLAIYFPDSRSAAAGDPDRNGYLRSNTLFPVAFVQDNAWAELVAAWLARVP